MSSTLCAAIPDLTVFPASPPCHPANTREAERLAVLLHNLHEECRAILEAHGHDAHSNSPCNCVACEVASGLSWSLAMAYTSLTSAQFPWWVTSARDEMRVRRKMQPVDVAKAARRLGLPMSMVAAFVEDETPKSL
jgi:hypothetical protein